MPPSGTPLGAGRYTRGRLDLDLRRIARALTDEGERDHLEDLDGDARVDRRLLELRALQVIITAAERLIDQDIALARRHEPVLTWGQIGAALGITGQSVGQRARTHGLL